MGQLPRDPEEARRRIDALTGNDPRHPGALRDKPGSSPDLQTQTPGLDADRPLVNGLLRLVSWARERPNVTFPVIGGLLSGAIFLSALGRIRERRTMRKLAMRRFGLGRFGMRRIKLGRFGARRFGVSRFAW